MKKIYLILMISLLFIVAALLAQTLLLGYEGTIGWFLECFNKSDRFDWTLDLVTKNRFNLLQAFWVVLIMAGGIAVYKSELICSYLQLFFTSLYLAFRNLWEDTKSKKLLIFLIIPFASSIYFGLTLPVSYDEAYTYLYFTNKPFYNCMMFYPVPNNHVLHSLLTNITEHIPFFDMLFRIRIPAIIVSLFTWVIAYSFIKKYYTEKIALFVVALSSMLFRSVYYSFMSRGYAMLVLFFIISLYAAFNIIKHGNKTKDWMFFVLSGILGCYTMPSFLYPFFTVNILILIYNYKNLKKQIISNLLTGIGVLILYAPIIIVMGLESLTNNPFVTPDRRTRFEVLESLPYFFNGTIRDTFGISYFIIPIVIIVSLLLVWRRKDKDNLILWGVFGITPALLLLVHSVIPFHRTFLYYGFLIVFLIASSWAFYIEKIKERYLIVALLVLQVVGSINFKLNINNAETFNTYAKMMHDVILEGGKTYNATSSFSRYNLRFEMAIRGYEEDSVKFVIDHSLKMDADTINNEDYVIIDVERDETQNKKPYYSDKYYNVYLNK